ncbi:hypothetical protein [Rickettsia rhipicephali]|nr:hypothetical protein [Rickettsia rhipicephali]
MAATIEKPLIDTIREDCSTIIQFFKDSNAINVVFITFSVIIIKILHIIN